MRDIVGTWRLVTTAALASDGTAMAPPYGPTPIGTVTFTREGRMIAALCDGRPELPGGEAAREYVSYIGAYTFDGSRLVTRVDATSDPSRLGTDQVREASFEGERMVLRPPPDRVGDVLRQRILTWEKISPA